MDLDFISKDIEALERKRLERLNIINNSSSDYNYKDDKELTEYKESKIAFIDSSSEFNSEPVKKNNENDKKIQMESSVETPNTRKNRLADLARQYSNWEDETKPNTNYLASPSLSSKKIETYSNTNKEAIINESAFKFTKNNENLSPNINSPLKGCNTQVFSPSKESNKQAYSPSKEVNRQVYSPLKEGNKQVYSPLKEGNKQVYSPLKEGNKQVYSPLKEGNKQVYSPSKNTKLYSESKIEVVQDIYAATNNIKSYTNEKSVLEIKSDQNYVATAKVIINSSDSGNFNGVYNKSMKSQMKSTDDDYKTNKPPINASSANFSAVRRNDFNNIKKATSDYLDCSIDEPTRKPVSERLNAWKNKCDSSATPKTVSNRVNSFEKKIFVSATKNKAASPRGQQVKSPQYSCYPTGSLDYKKTPTVNAEKSVSSEKNNVVNCGVAKRNSSNKRIAPQFSPQRFISTYSNSVVKTPPRAEVNTISNAAVKKDFVGDSGSVKRGSPADKKSAEKKNRMREDFEDKLKALGFDMDSSGKYAEVKLPPIQPNEHEDLPTSTAKPTRSFAAGKTPPAKSSIYALVKKTDAAPTPFTHDNKAECTRLNGELVTPKMSNLQDSFDSVESVEVKPCLGKSGVKFGTTTIKEYVPTTDTDSTTEILASDLEQPTLDSTDDDINDHNKNIDSCDYISSSDENNDGQNSNDEGSNEDEEQIVNKLDLSELLDDDDNDVKNTEIFNDDNHAMVGDDLEKQQNYQTSQLYPEVVMRKKSVARRRSSLDSFKKPRGYISILEYRRQTRPKSQPPQNRNRLPQNHEEKRVTVAAQESYTHKRLYPELPTDTYVDKLPLKTDKQRLQELDAMIQKEHVVIQQTSNALNKCCHVQSAFASSPEAVECHRLLLMACKKREAFMLEMQNIRRDGCQRGQVGQPRGRLTISNLRMPLKSEFLSRMGSLLDTSIHYFIIILKSQDNQIFFTNMVSTHDWMSRRGSKNGGRGYIDFPNQISFDHISENFVIDLEIFGMSMSKPIETLSPKKKRNGTPRKLLTPKMTRKLESPAGPMTIRSTNFMLISSLRVNKAMMQRQQFNLDKIALLCPLQGTLTMQMNCALEQTISLKGFLTMFEETSGLGAWHRRWCHLKSDQLMYWTYPNDESFKAPIGVIDLKLCATKQINSVSREMCARPYTFEVLTHRNAQNARYWLSADTREEKEDWMEGLNKSLVNTQAWRI